MTSRNNHPQNQWEKFPRWILKAKVMPCQAADRPAPPPAHTATDFMDALPTDGFSLPTIKGPHSAACDVTSASDKLQEQTSHDGTRLFCFSCGVLKSLLQSGTGGDGKPLGAADTHRRSSEYESLKFFRKSWMWLIFKVFSFLSVIKPNLPPFFLNVDLTKNESILNFFLPLDLQLLIDWKAAAST